MDVLLPSGHTATFRDQFMRGDRRDAQRGIVLVINADGSRRIEGGVATEVASRIIRRMLVSWDFPGLATPSQCATEDLGDRILDGLDDDDAQALEKAVGPWVEKVMQVDRGPVFRHAGTGIRVTVVNAADADKLAALGEWEREGEGDPKTALSGGSGSTGISSSENPELPGLMTPDSTPPILS